MATGLDSMALGLDSDMLTFVTVSTEEAHDMLMMIGFYHGFPEEVPDMLTMIGFCHCFPEEVPDMWMMIVFYHSLSGRSA